jgi:hypothetical protein
MVVIPSTIMFWNSIFLKELILSMIHKVIIFLSIICFIFSSGNIAAETSGNKNEDSKAAASEDMDINSESDGTKTSLEMLHSIITLKKDLKKIISQKKRSLSKVFPRLNNCP